jgi:hypothetical protein
VSYSQKQGNFKIKRKANAATDRPFKRENRYPSKKGKVQSSLLPLFYKLNWNCNYGIDMKRLLMKISLQMLPCNSVLKSRTHPWYIFLHYLVEVSHTEPAPPVLPKFQTLLLRYSLNHLTICILMISFSIHLFLDKVTKASFLMHLDSQFNKELYIPLWFLELSPN